MCIILAFRAALLYVSTDCKVRHNSYAHKNHYKNIFLRIQMTWNRKSITASFFFFASHHILQKSYSRVPMLGFPHLAYKEVTFQRTWWTIIGLKCMISKYNQTSYVINEIQHLYISFPLYFLPTCSSFHLSCKEPFKWTPTETIINNNNNNNNYKALSCGTTPLCFHKCDKSNGATLFPANKSDQSSGLVHSGPLCLQKKVLPRFWPPSEI